MKKIKLVDVAFSHGRTTTDLQVSKYIEWDRSPANEKDLVIVTDNSIYSVQNIHGNKIGLMIEPSSINPNLYEWIKSNSNLLTNLLTYDKTLLDICDNAIFYPHGGCWVLPEDQNIHKKSKNLSIISSDKTMTFGHRLRHRVIDKMKKNSIEFDLFGRGYKQINNKIDGLKNYRYSVVIENTKTDYYFTEKLIDCFRAGTIPIYWGCPSIGDFFDLGGILTFNTEDELMDLLTNISEDDYNKRIESINKNFELSEQYLLIENWLYNNIDILK